jgi:glutamyl-tRNA(Gln) amidotransferase subunit E
LNPQSRFPESPLPPHLDAIAQKADREVDWSALGLRGGLEIHQQLFTARKLFCRCPAGLYSDKYDAEVIRHMRPTLSELGQYDGTALMEFRTRKQILYLLNRDSVCTYEMDDTPPFLVNQNALDIALEIALLLNCNIVGELHVMRKQYLDGSIPTGFQRTAIVGVNGSIPFRGRNLTIRQLALEEDACREVSDEGHTITFTTDRLSMPLVEVVTAPELRTPSEFAEATEILGRLLRSTGKVRRGAGATRQDVNVSIRGGTRVEIKGVPSVRLIADLVRHEALRQKGLLELRDAMIEQSHEPYDAARRGLVDHIVKNTESRVIQKALKRGDRVGAIRIKNFASALCSSTVAPQTFAHELAGRVRVVACLDEPPHILHRAMQGPDALSNREWRAIRKKLRARAEDGVVVIWGKKDDIQTAFEEIELRALEGTLGIPPETRQVLAAGYTDFERILPGPDRMYPDTDLPPVAIGDERVETARRALPQPPRKRELRYLELGLPRHMTYSLSISPRAALFDQAVERGCDPKLTAELVSEKLVALGRSGAPVDLVRDADLLALLEALRDGQFFREGIDPVLTAIIQRREKSHHGGPPQINLAELLETLSLTPLDEAEVQKRLHAVVEKEPAPQSSDPKARWRYYMGQAMLGSHGALRGRVPGARVAQLLNDKLSAP